MSDIVIDFKTFGNYKECEGRFEDTNFNRMNNEENDDA